jgi:RNA polymerase sigma-70 factor (ECF subfamily)
MNSTATSTPETEVAVYLARAQQGDADAFGELCRVFEAPLRRQAMALCGNAVAADDLAQDTLVSAWKSLPRYNGRCQFFTWLTAILMHHHHSRLRQPWTRWVWPHGHESGAASPLDHLADEADGPDQALVQSEHAALMRQNLENLPKKHREVVVLRFYVDESLEGIAAVLNCSVGTVKSRLFHALEKLRKMKGVAKNMHDTETLL